MTTGIAGSVNVMGKGIVNPLLTPDMTAQIETTLDNIAVTFRELTPAVNAFLQAFVDIATTGSSFLPGMAQGLSQMSAEFAAFVREAQANGSLEQFIRDGIDAAHSLATAVWQLGQFVYQVFGSDGRQNVEDFNDTLEGTITVLSMLNGDFSNFGADIREELNSLTGPAATVRDAILDIPEALTAVGNGVIDMVNKVKHGLDFMSRNFTNAMNLLTPGEDKTFTPLPDIPHLPSSWGGDWGGWTRHQ